MHVCVCVYIYVCVFVYIYTHTLVNQSANMKEKRKIIFWWDGSRALLLMYLRLAFNLLCGPG
jgi:hypothetical protein